MMHKPKHQGTECDESNGKERSEDDAIIFAQGNYFDWNMTFMIVGLEQNRILFAGFNFFLEVEILWGHPPNAMG